MLLFHEHHKRNAWSRPHDRDEAYSGRASRFSIVGGGVGVVKGLSELRTRWQAVFLKSWPLLLIILGVLLMRYNE